MARVKVYKGFEGMPQLIASIKKIPAEMEARVKELVDDTANMMVYDAVNNLRQNNSVVYGSLMQSIEAIPKKGGMGAIVVARSNYAAPVEFGTKGKVSVPQGLEQYASQFKGLPEGGNMQEFYENILDWVIRKGIAEDEVDGEHIAYAIMSSIWKYGANPHPFFFPAWFKNSAEFEVELKKMFKRTLLQRLKDFFKEI